MALYSLLGNVIGDAYDKVGVSINKAYNISGEAIYNASRDYSTYSISDLFGISGSGLSGSTFQAFDIYNGVIAQVRHSSYLCLIDLQTHNIINSGMACQVGHGNSFSFSRVFYNANDEFPLSYATDGYKYVYVNRVTRQGCTLIKTYKTDPTGHGGYLMGAVPSHDGKTLYTLGYTFEDYETDRSGTNLVKVAKWNLQNETPNGDGTYLPEFISESTIPFILCIQGCQYYDGMIFASSGLNGTSQNVFLIDPENAQIKYTVQIGNTTETEGCAWVGNDYLIIGQNPNTISYKKVEFAEVS